MEEVAALSPSDSLRHQVETEIVVAGKWAQDEWILIQSLDAALRIKLREAQSTPAFEERLLSLVEDTRKARSNLTRRFSRRALAFAGVGLMVLLMGLLWFKVGEHNRSNRLKQIGLAAITDFSKNSEVTVESADRSLVLATLSPTVQFKAGFPALDEEYLLLGGRRCSINGNAVIKTDWIRDGIAYSLYQFCPEDFGLENRIPTRRVSQVDANRTMMGNAVIWSEGDCAYVLTSGSSLPQIPKLNQNK